MVVGMMKWRPWPPISSRKFEAKIIIQRLQGSIENSQDYWKLYVEVKWKGSNKSINPLSFKRRSVRRNVTKEGSLKDDGIVEFNEEFVAVCNFLGLKDGGFHQWDVAFKVFDGLNQGPKNKYCSIASGSLNLAEFASSAEQTETDISIPLSTPNGITESGATLNVSLHLQELRTLHESTEQGQRTVIPLPSSPRNVQDESSGFKAGLKKVKLFKTISNNQAKTPCREEEGSDGKSSVRSYDADYPFDTDSTEPDEVDSEEVKDEESAVRKSFSYGTLAYANHAGGLSHFNSGSSEDEDLIYYRNYKEKTDYSSESIIDPAETQILKRSIFPWRKRKLSFRSPKNKGEPLLKKDSGEEGGDDIDFDRRMLSSSDECKSDEDTNANRCSISEFGDDNFAVGSWEKKEIVSRDGHMKLETQVFFASIDQRSERAAGESACTALVAVIADWFQNNWNEMPIKSQFDSLIRDGSLEWRNLCENEVYRERFPDKHFDLETVLQAKIRNLAVVPEKSFIGFFQPEGIKEGDLHFLDGAMSFDGIWDEISKIGSSYTDNMNPLVYIVSWNDHFFMLKVERDAYYIIDTLGERLYEGCNQAYLLKFDKDTVIESLPIDTQKSNETPEGEKVNESQSNEISSAVAASKDNEIVCKGKESCKEYIKSFLAAIPIRELQADLKKGLMAASTTVVHHRLQIEFHHTERSLA
ncbi:putative NT-type C2 domain-containing protein [Helianthus annuus]|nr:putative NT-type C2 domain-containing protein [Helianthus annuus]KAJ0661113.1 putative NT-type C2 domain-containing protein [Helianthus annuus]KAJ0841691.1 putative NT-type C2 domain-containing protein [Helianthus annuus]